MHVDGMLDRGCGGGGRGSMKRNGGSGEMGWWGRGVEVSERAEIIRSKWKGRLDQYLMPNGPLGVSLRTPFSWRPVFHFGFYVFIPSQLV